MAQDYWHCRRKMLDALLDTVDELPEFRKSLIYNLDTYFHRMSDAQYNELVKTFNLYCIPKKWENKNDR